jgi:hypothetical protein
MFSRSTRFSLNGTFESQMSTLAVLRVSDPVKSEALFKLGENLVQLSSSGQLRNIIQLVNDAKDDEIMFYFIVKMFHNALINGHLMVAAFIIDQGYPLNNSLVPNALIDALNIVDDYQAASLVDFLVVVKGMDVNSQAKRTWLTPLHIAIKRGLIETFVTLLKNGADINAVAEGDCY